MNNLTKYISFTKNETKVILFIVTVLVAGFSIKYYKQVINNDLNTSYDFSSSDSEFNRLSDNIKKNSSENEKRDTLNNSGHGEIREKIVNINTATKSELIDLPGIGESTAEKIILYRESEKGFRKTEELMNVKGIGKKKYEKIKSYIKTE